MVLDAEIKAQLNNIMQMMENDIVLKVSAGDDKVSKEMLALRRRTQPCHPKSQLKKRSLSRTPSFSVNRPEKIQA